MKENPKQEFSLTYLFRRTIYFIHKHLFFYHYKKLTKLLAPTLLGIQKIGLGKTGDGTYILPAGIIPDEACLLSFGIDDDISFEEDFFKLFPHSNIYAFDPTINQLPDTAAPIKFKSIGIAGRVVKRKKLITLQDVINTNKIAAEKQIILKIDIEGWEWGVLKTLVNISHHIPVVAAEFHVMETTSKLQVMCFPLVFWKRLRIIQKLLNNYYILHLHVNNYKYSYFKQFTFPWVFEITLVHKSCFKENIMSDIQKLNVTTWKDKPDIQFPFFK